MSQQHEPSNLEIMEFMRVKFARVERKLDEHEVHFKNVDIQLLSINNNLTSLNQRLAKVEKAIEDQIEIIEPLAVAFDSSSERQLDHEKRITRLEKKALPS